MILVTGATGNVGAEVIHALPNKSEILAAVLDVEQARQQLQEDCEYVAFDFTDSASFPALLERVDKIFLVRPPAIADVAVFEPLIVAAKAANVQQIVFLSLQGVEKVSFVPHAKIEALIEESGIPYTFLRSGFFMQNLNTTHRQDIAENDEIFIPAGKSRTAFIDVRDLGAIAARVLTEPGHSNKAYILTGSEALNYHEVAQAFTEQLGRPIRYPNPSVLSFVWRMWRRGNKLQQVIVMAFLYTITRMGQAKEVSPEAEQLLGRPPHSLAEYVRDYRACWEPSSALT